MFNSPAIRAVVVSTVATMVSMVALLAALTSFPAHADDVTRSQRVMQETWGAMMDAEWRTPNPDFEAGGNTPRAFTIRWRWDGHRQYAIGELLGIFGSGDEEKEVRYWDLYSFHNPATGEITGMQIGWDGSLASGPMRRAPDGAIVFDQVLYNADGSMNVLRHEDLLAPDGKSYRSNVYERDERDEWALVRKWTWTKQE